MKHHNELNMLAQKDFKEYDDMYKVVDFLNKNLKSHGLVFGLSKKRDGITDVIAIYTTQESDAENK